MNNLRRKVVLFSALFVVASLAIGAGTVFNRNHTDAHAAGGINNGSSLTLTDASAETLVVTKTNSSHATMAILATDAVQVLTGNFRVGNGVPTETHNGEDAYFEGITEFDGTMYIDGVASHTANIILNDDSGAPPTIALTDGTGESATIGKVDGSNLTITTAAADGVQVLVGNLLVGNGTPDISVNGEDAYCEGTLEVDGAARFDGALDINGAVVRTSQEYIINAGGKPGSANGWLTTGGLVNLFNYTLPASEGTTATLVFPISGLHVGDTITAWKLVGQGESAGNTAELDGDLRSITTVSTGNTDASVGAIVGINIVADTAIATAKTGLTETVAANKTYYVLLSGTTAANTDFDIQGVTVTVTTN